MNNKISEAFQEAFSTNCSGCVRDCFCGRTHFDDSAANRWDWEPGELEKLVKLSAEHPDKCIRHDGSVGTVMVDGKEWVIGCACGGPFNYEAFIMKHAQRIIEFFSRRAIELRKQADEIDVAKKMADLQTGPAVETENRKP